MTIAFRADPPTLEEHLLYLRACEGNTDALITLMQRRAVGFVGRQQILDLDYRDANEAKDRCLKLMELGGWSDGLLRRSPENEQADLTYAEAKAFAESAGNGMEEEDVIWGA